MRKNNQVLRLVEDKVFIPRKTSTELWPERRRAMHSLHYALGYYACFRPELTQYFIEQYSRKGEVVFDPFSGRGTTALQANLMGRTAYASDANPLAVRITAAKSLPIGLDEVVLRLNEIDLGRPVDLTDFQNGLGAFYHPNTYRELVQLKRMLRAKPDRVNAFIELLALSRLHGHNSGYFSAYTAPQRAFSPERQIQLNLRRREVPEYRAVVPRIIRRAAETLSEGFSRDFFESAAKNAVRLSDARSLQWLADDAVDLVVTAPPLPDSFCYEQEQWLEHWFCDFPLGKNDLYRGPDLVMWREFVGQSLREMLRVLKPGAVAVVALGEVMGQNGPVFLDEALGSDIERVTYGNKRFRAEELIIHQQRMVERAQGSAAPENGILAANSRVLVLRCGTRTSPRPSLSPARR